MARSTSDTGTAANSSFQRRPPPSAATCESAPRAELPCFPPRRCGSDGDKRYGTITRAAPMVLDRTAITNRRHQYDSRSGACLLAKIPRVHPIGAVVLGAPVFEH